MKFNFSLIICAYSIIIGTFLIKEIISKISSQRKTNKIKKVKSDEYEIVDIKKKFNSIFKDMNHDRDIFDFSIGAIEAIYSLKDFDGIYLYNSDQYIFPKIQECMSNKSFKEAMMNEKKIPIDVNWDKLKNEDDLYEFCLKAKKDVMNKFNKRKSWKSYISSFVSDDSDKNCDLIDDKIPEMIKIRYYNECFEFKHCDCKKIKNGIFTYVSEFLAKSNMYSTSISNVVDCLRKNDFVWKSDKFESFKEESKNSVWMKIREEWYKYNSKNQIEEWGGIKGSYYLYELGKKLKNLNEDIFLDSNGKYYNKNGKNYYHLGNIVGKSLKIVHLVKTEDF